MYDELISALRQVSEDWGAHDFAEEPSYVRAIIKEAADAIEELSKYANTVRRLKCEGYYLQQIKYHDGYQAVSTMPLPEPPKEE
jgi:hypothetical protein